LDKAFRFAVGSQGVGTGEVVADALFGAHSAEQMRATNALVSFPGWSACGSNPVRDPVAVDFR
jgi:hypothetical protein